MACEQFVNCDENKDLSWEMLFRLLVALTADGCGALRAIKQGGSDPVPLGLRLEFTDINGTPVGDATNLDAWNNFFNLPINGEPFTSVFIDGNTVVLIGGANISTADHLFDSNKKLISLVDQEQCLTYVGTDSFSFMEAFTSFVAHGVTTISDNAFRNSAALTTIGAYACQEVGEYAFFSCSALSVVGIPACLGFFNHVFEDCTALTTISLPVATGFGIAAFKNSGLITINAPNLQIIGDDCFADTDLIEAIFPVLETMGDRAFQRASSLTTITLPLISALGISPNDDACFEGVETNEITLTIPLGMMTAGEDRGPEGDILFLLNNNIVDLITV